MSEAGHSLLETILVLGLLGLLAGVGVGGMGNPGLIFLPGELLGTLDRARLLAMARGGPVRVALKGPGGEWPPLVLPRGFRWGLPTSKVPFPKEMEPTLVAHRTGEAHPIVTVTPRHTATANVWFLTDGRDALCLRLNDRGEPHLLRWRKVRRAWKEI